MGSNDRLSVAVQAVRRASAVCRAVQAALVTEDTLTKKDRSPVTVADFASQAVVCATLSEALPGEPVVAEEDAADLRGGENATLAANVASHVSSAMGREVGVEQALDWIDLGGASATSGGSYWTLDPIDGTKGFLRKEQYAVALGLIEDNQVVLGALGCPNLPLSDGGEAGTLLVAERGRGTRVLPLWSDDMDGRAVSVSAIASPAEARFCESVESGHSDQDASVKIARRLGITTPPVRMDSQCKYAAVARGDASIYLRLPTRADYREKIWDHAAGLICVVEAGGQVTDIDGKPLDFSHGRTFAENRGVVATNGAVHNAVIEAIRAAF